MYLNCPRCRLAMRMRGPSVAARHCPRCAARAGVRVDLFTSPLPYERLVPAGRPSPDGAPVARRSEPEALAG